ncbi:hypothetical protein [Flavobacterium sp. 25HG05S-40]|uniref:hypothetical protein n=1 Tax=Flavobacterium sp. 25HG05S-40 TaxID=3458682 RepID=UPI004044A4D5
MVLAIFFLIVFLQVFCYIMIDSKKVNIHKLWILTLFFLFYFLILPYILYQIQFNNIEEKPRCALPVVGMIGACWVFGGGITLIAHLLYYAVKKLLAKG